MKKQTSSADLIPMPERADIVAIVEILLKRVVLAPKDGLLWLEGDCLSCGAWHYEGDKRSPEVLEKVFQGSLSDISWKWSSAMYELQVRATGKLYRIKLNGESAISAVAQDAAASIDLPGLKLIGIAEQMMDLHRTKGIWHAWEAALKSAS